MATTACSATFTHRAPSKEPNADQAATQHRYWASSFVFGLLGAPEYDVRDSCGQAGAQSVEIGASPLTVLTTLVTLGIYTPNQVWISCHPSLEEPSP